MANRPQVTVIIPAFGTQSDQWLHRMTAHYPQRPEVEYLVVGDQMSPVTLSHLENEGFSFVSCPESTRARKLQVGVESCESPWLLLHHPRSLLSHGAFDALLVLQKGGRPTWGGFRHRFDQRSLGLRWTSFYSNSIRPRLWGILYLDHCIFFHRSLLDQNIPDIPIFEDTEISKILRKKGRPLLLDVESTTSAIRFQQNGFWRQAFQNQLLKAKYWLKRSPSEMNQAYEKKLKLNGP